LQVPGEAVEDLLGGAVADRPGQSPGPGDRMNTPKYQPGEVDISAALAARLIAEQFPHWAGLPIRPVTAQGTWAVMYRLGGQMAIRLPRVPRAGGLGPVHEDGVLPRLAPSLPVPVPELIALGRPAAGYPCSWGVTTWIDGDTAAEGRLTEPGLLAADLAGFLNALWNIDTTGGKPAPGGLPLATRHDFTLDAIRQLHGLIDTDAARTIWDNALRLPPWAGPDTWVHGDMMPGNILTRNGRLAAVIDFDSTGLGDPSRDLIVAWMLLPAHVRPAFRRAVGAGDATWLRGRARALSIALGHLDYYDNLNAVMADNARYTIREVLDDYSSSGQ
jgi:aminoglycoside phosphotransferase (APT) family kinase protein